ncbi:MAG: hypothetical protein KatS3mg131_3620 [Candidatus Tectimicrobiota bacterium]|nr:MAG: hypothetical protein KatS3mg131_3620 [Candidatus Tectomicrobia bacterium]
MHAPLPPAGVFAQMIGALLLLVALLLGLASLGNRSILPLLVALGLGGMALWLLRWGRQRVRRP